MIHKINNKGQVQALAPAILTLIFAAIILVFGLVMTQSLESTQTGKVSDSVANQSLTAWVEGTNQSVGKNTNATCGFGDVTTASVVVYNESGSTIIPAGNYTVYSDGNIINLSSDVSAYAWQVSYPYTWGGEACDAANATTAGLGTFADFWEIIVLAIVITVVIGLLLVVFGGGRRR